MHHDQAAAVLQGVAQVVGDHDGGQLPLAHHAVGHLHDHIGGVGVKGGGVLVQDQEIRGAQAAHGHRQGLALAAGQAAGPGVHHVFQPHAQFAQHLLPGGNAGFVERGHEVHALELALGQGHVFGDAHIGAGAHRRVLVDAGDAAAAGGFLLAGDILPVQQDLPGVGRHGSADQVEQGGLAGAVGADDGDKLPLFHLEVEAAQQRQLAHGTRVIGL